MPRRSHQAQERFHCDAYVIRVLPAKAAAEAEATRAAGGGVESGQPGVSGRPGRVPPGGLDVP